MPIFGLAINNIFIIAEGDQNSTTKKLKRKKIKNEKG